MRLIPSILESIKVAKGSLSFLTEEGQTRTAKLQALAIQLIPPTLEKTEKDRILVHCEGVVSNPQAKFLERTYAYKPLSDAITLHRDSFQLELEKVLLEIKTQTYVKKYSVADLSQLPPAIFRSLQDNVKIIQEEEASMKDREIVPLAKLLHNAYQLTEQNLAFIDQQPELYLDFLEFLQTALTAYRVALKKESIISMLKFNCITGLILELAQKMPEKKQLLETLLMHLREAKTQDVMTTQEFLAL
jgi:hypothetical protein